LQKKQYRNRAGVLGGFAGKSPHNAAAIFPNPCSGTSGSWLHAFLGKTGASPKVKSYVTLPFLKTAIARVWKHPCSGLILQHLGKQG